jgi:Domain of unknown function (DUF4105)
VVGSNAMALVRAHALRRGWRVWWLGLAVFGMAGLAKAESSFDAVYKVVSGQDQAPQAIHERYRAAWLADPTFDCIHPLIARHFAQERPDARPAAACTGKLPFAVRNREGHRALRWVDPATVRGIHLLFSGRGEAWASRFGHVSLRLVVCPGLTSSAAACDENLQAHLVLGFLATVDTVAIDPLRGMLGGYAAHLHAMPFMDAYREYTIDEFRDLYALPLRLDAARLRQIVSELSEIHWQFADEYRFLNNNCATMLQTAMRMVMPELFQGASAPGYSWRPDSFFEDMRQSHMAVSEALDDLAQAERQGHFFASTRGIFEQAAHMVTQAIQWPGGADLQGYLAAPSSVRLAAWRADPLHAQRLRQERRLREAQLMLEELAAVRAAQRAWANAVNYLTRPGLQAALEARRAQMNPLQSDVLTRCVLEPMARLRSAPVRHDGIPAAGVMVQATARADWMGPGCADELGGTDFTQLLAQVDPEGQVAWQAVLSETREIAAVVNNVIWVKALAP